MGTKFSCILIVLLLASCAPASTPTTFPSIATLTPTPLPTDTITATSIPASPTVDPNAPKDYARYENSIYYLDQKTDKGNTLTYTWDKERKSWYRLIFSGYAWDLAQEMNNGGIADKLLMKLYVDAAIKGAISLPTFIHKDNTDSRNAVNFTNLFEGDLFQALIDRGVIKSLSDFRFSKWDNNEYYLDFVNADGPQRLGLWPGITMNVHIRGDYAALKANMATNGFSETQKSYLYGPANSYMIKIWTDKDNNGYVDIAPSLPASQWTEAMFNQIAFIGFGDIFEFSDLTHPELGRVTAEFALNQKKLPYFTYGPPQ
jgi:hypothetical protein